MAAVLTLWSRPITIQYPDEEQYHLLVPVASPSQQQQQQDAAHLPASGGGMAVAIVRVSVQRRGVGALHLVVESAHSEPPYLLENRTPVTLQYRQVDTFTLSVLWCGLCVCRGGGACSTTR